MSGAYVCLCICALSFIGMLIGMIVVTVRALKPDCSQFTNCYDCAASPCGVQYSNYTNRGPHCTQRCFWNTNNMEYFLPKPICSTTSASDTSICTGVDVTATQPSLFIFFWVVGGLSVFIGVMVAWCMLRKKGDAKRQAELDERASLNSYCGSCNHQKHHGSTCYEQVDNRKSACTCEHSHHKPSVCREQVSYVEYKTERKNVSVDKTRTTYHTETRNEPVVKTRMKTVDQGGYVQVPYGPGTGTYSVYQSRMVSIPETYTEYESRTVQVPHTEHYTVQEMQDVQTPITKYRTCGCDGSRCACYRCIPQVDCGCTQCDCGECTGRKNVKQNRNNRYNVMLTVGILFTLNFLIVYIFGVNLASNGQTVIITANQFNHPEWKYNSYEAAKWGIGIGWFATGFYAIALAASVFVALERFC